MVVFGPGSGRIVFNHTGTDYVFAPGISGVGVVNVVSGTTILSGPNINLTGPTTLSGGRMTVDGSIASSTVTVGPSGTLGGDGKVGATTINGGTLAPGKSIGTLTVIGSVTFAAGSTYAVEVSRAGANRVNALDVATLSGATVNASFAPGSYVARRYTILNARALNGSFEKEIDTNLPFNFRAGLSYDTNNVYLDLSLDLAAVSGTSFTANQSGVAGAVMNHFNSHGGIPLELGGLTPAGLTQAAGELATGAQTTSTRAMSQFLSAMADPSQEDRGVSIASGLGRKASPAIPHRPARRSSCRRASPR